MQRTAEGADKGDGEQREDEVGRDCEAFV
jgi:hypothetical protein